MKWSLRPPPAGRTGLGIEGPILACVFIVAMVVIAVLSDDPPPPSSPGASVEEILADLDGNAELARPIGRALDRADAIFKEDRSEIAIMTVDIKNTIRKETGRELRCQEIIANVCSTVPENAHDTTMSYSDTAAGWVTRLEENR